jgi:hypothetical protein
MTRSRLILLSLLLAVASPVELCAQTSKPQPSTAQKSLPTQSLAG